MTRTLLICLTLLLGITTASARCGADFKPIRTHRDLGTHAGMAGGGHTELACRSFAVHKLTRDTALNQGQTSRWGAFTIKRRSAQIGRMTGVIPEAEEGHRHRFTEGLALGEAEALENRSGVEQIAEGPHQIEKRLWTEHAGIRARVNRGVIEMGNGQLSGLVDTALNIKFIGAMSEANGSSAA